MGRWVTVARILQITLFGEPGPWLVPTDAIAGDQSLFNPVAKLGKLIQCGHLIHGLEPGSGIIRYMTVTEFTVLEEAVAGDHLAAAGLAYAARIDELLAIDGTFKLDV